MLKESIRLIQKTDEKVKEFLKTTSKDRKIKVFGALKSKINELNDKKLKIELKINFKLEKTVF